MNRMYAFTPFLRVVVYRPWRSHVCRRFYSLDALSEKPSLKGDKTHICPLCRRVFNTVKQLQFHTIDRHGSVISGSGDLEKVDVHHDVLKSSQGMHLISNAMNKKSVKGNHDSRKINLGIEPPVDLFTKSGYTDSPHRSKEPKHEHTFFCPHCPKSFRMEEALNVHISLTHRGKEKTEVKSNVATKTVVTKSFSDLLHESSLRNLNSKIDNENEVTEMRDQLKPLTQDPFSMDIHALPQYVTSASRFPFGREVHLSPLSNSFSVFSGYSTSKIRAGHYFESKVGEFFLSQTLSEASENVIIRCFEGERNYLSHITQSLSDYSGRLLVIGVSKLLPVREIETGIVHYYPAIHVQPPFGAIHKIE